MNAPAVVLGLRANARQFALLVVLNAFVGAVVGLERTVLPLLAEREFGLASKTAVLSFLVGFGVVKAFANLAAGRFADRGGRKQLLVVGWLFGIPVPFLLIAAPTWEWVLFANVLLGVNQGFCWSMTVIMKIDLVGPRRRGLAMGLNEFAGYVGVAASALATGYLATIALRPHPFVPGIALALAGLALSALFVRETMPHARREEAITAAAGEAIDAPSFREVFARTSWKNRSLFASSQAGLVNNLNDAMAWGLLPLFLASAGLPIEQVGIVAAAYPGVWGIAQLVTGPMSDKVGRKWMIATGMWIQAGGIASFITGTASRPGSRRRRSWDSGPRSCIRRSSPRCPTWRAHRGARRRSVCTGCGGISASPRGRSSSASWRTARGRRPRYFSWRVSPSPPARWSRR